ncbi:MAG: hypothetical protein AB1451_10335 [Nitrospirota bacterium]
MLSATLTGTPQIHAASKSFSASSLVGVDSNVFLSDTNPASGQQPQSSTFLQTSLSAELGTDSARTHRLGLSLQGLYKHYFRFGEADKLFADSALAYRYAAAPSLLFGVVQTFSYAKLQLLDTEGNTLPRDRFIAYSGEVRGYTQWLAARSRLTVGAGLRKKDINETADQVAVTFQSLDHQGYFAYLDGMHRLRRVDFGLGYEYTVLHYDELRAAFRDSTTSEANPLLTLVQHTARSQVAVRLSRWGRLSLDGQARWTHDTFEDELTYRQFDVLPRGELRLPFELLLSGGAGYRSRVYAERLGGGQGAADQRRERFLQADASLRKSLIEHLSVIAQAQFIRKTSNVPGDEFREQVYALGLSLAF